MELMQDPRWGQVELLIRSYVDPLMDFNTLDDTQPAEHVKAELIGRKIAYNSMVEFLNSTLLVSNKINKVKEPFR